MMKKLKSGTPFVYDENDRVVGIRDPHTGTDTDLVTAVTSPGGVVRLFAGSQDLNPLSAENRLVTINNLPYLAFSENSRYMFGNDLAARISRIAKSDGTVTISPVATTLYMEDGITTFTSAGFVNAWAWDDYQLAQVKDFSTAQHYLYKSVDDFASMGNNSPLYNNGQPVFMVGSNPAQTEAAPEINIMANWSLARGENWRGEDLIVFGQYAGGVPGKVPGGYRDWVSVFCSRDGGNTYEAVLQLNTGGTNIVKHCHAVQYDPYAKEFWCQFGDAATSAIYVWDGVGAIAPNTIASQAAQYRGWRGMDKWNNPTQNDYNLQSTVLLFVPGEVIAPIDQGFSSKRGIYRFARDLSVFEAITDPTEIQQPEGHAFYSGTICKRTGAAIVSTLIEAEFTDPTSDYTLWIWVATPAGGYRDWKRVGRYMVNTATGSRAHSVFYARDDGTILIGMGNCAGMPATTSICRIDGIHDGEEEVIHPVYWVDPENGSNANTGQSLEQAWASVGYACSANRMTTAALLNVLPGTGSEGSSAYTVTIAAYPKPAQTNSPLRIKGAGRGRTRIVSSCPTPWLTNGATKVSFDLESMSVENTVGAIYDFGSGATQDKVARFRDVRLKSATSPFFLTSGTIEVRQFDATCGQYLGAGAGTGDYAFVLEAGVARGGSRIVYFRGGAAAACRVENVVGIGQTVAGVEVLAAAVNLPTVRNVAVDAAKPVVIDGRTVKTSADGLVEYNVSRAASTGLVGGDVGSKVVADLMLIGSTGAPKPGSPLIGAGNASAGPVFDINGVAYGTPKNVGAFA